MMKDPPYTVENIAIGKDPDVEIWCQYFVKSPDLFIPEIESFKFDSNIFKRDTRPFFQRNLFTFFFRIADQVPTYPWQ